MNNKKGITLVVLIVTIIVMIIIASVAIVGCMDIKIENIDTQTQEINHNCEHEWVITSEYDYMFGAFRTISKCAKCGSKI